MRTVKFNDIFNKFFNISDISQLIFFILNPLLGYVNFYIKNYSNIVYNNISEGYLPVHILKINNNKVNNFVIIENAIYVNSENEKNNLNIYNNDQAFTSDNKKKIRLILISRT